MAPNNVLPFHGNDKTMNLNNMIITNIQASPYFKNHLYELKTYHEVLDEIYYKVGHLEPWEKNSRKTAGQTGMCGGVRGVGSGGIVSSAFCLLYKLYTLKVSRKQLNSLINHTDSPYIRGLGFLYIRYTQPPGDLYDWLEPYLDDDEEIDVKAGGGASMTIGAMVRSMLTKLDWWATLFPRIPVPIQKRIEVDLKARAQAKIAELEAERAVQQQQEAAQAEANKPVLSEREERHSSHRDDDRSRDRKRSRSRERKRSRSRDRDGRHGDRHDRYRQSDRRDDVRSRDPNGRSHDARDCDGGRYAEKRRSRETSRDRKKSSRDDSYRKSSSHKHKHHKRSRSRSPRDRKKSRSRERGRETSFERDLKRERDRQYTK